MNEKRACAQFEKFHFNGLRLSHSTGIFIYTFIRDLQRRARAGVKYGARRIECHLKNGSLHWNLIARIFCTRRFHAAVWRARRSYEKNLRALGFSFPARVYGNLRGQVGRMERAILSSILDIASSDAQVNIFHPAVYAEDRCLIATSAVPDRIRSADQQKVQRKMPRLHQVDQLLRTGTGANENRGVLIIAIVAQATATFA